MKHSWHGYAIAVALALVAYAPTLTPPFIWDDHVMIEQNPYLRSWSVANVKHDFTSDVFNGQGDPYYRPLQTLLNRVDFSIWDARPFGFRLTNLILHLVNVVLVLRFILILGFSLPVATLCAIFFGVHPVFVEDFIDIAGRAELMAFTFSLSAILLLLRSSVSASIGGLVCFALALLSKESAVVVPGFVALVFAWRKEPLRRGFWPGIMFLMLVPYLIVRHRAVGPLPLVPDISLWLRFIFQAFPHVVMEYFQLLVFPWNLHSHRLVPAISFLWPVWLVSLGLLIGLLTRSTGKVALFALTWFFFALLPKLPVMVAGGFMLEHWMYPACVGPLLLLSYGLARALEIPAKKTLAAFATVGMIFFWTILVHLNVVRRGSDEKLYRWALHFTTSTPIKTNLGILLLQTDRPKEAIPYLRAAYDLYPESLNTGKALALAHWNAQEPCEALRVLRQLTTTTGSDEPAKIIAQIRHSPLAKNCKP